MIPSRLFITLVTLWSGFALPLYWFDPLRSPWIASGILLLLFSSVDALRVRRRLNPVIKRHLSSSLALGQDVEIDLMIHNQTRDRLHLRVHDEVPPSFEYSSMPTAVSIPGESVATLRYPARPVRRGTAHFPGVTLRLLSPAALWWRQTRIVTRSKIKVYPNFAAITQLTLLALDNRETAMGVQRKRQRGEGLDFHQLREYREGDSLRQIDWKATTRLRKLISREYQQERDQRIIFLLDCGHRMTTRDGALSHFDQALNSMLLLAYVALRQGDAIGLQCFGGEQRALPARKGLATVTRLLNFSYDLYPCDSAPDYLNASRILLQRERRRSLVVWLTNLRDDDTEELRPTLRLLRKRHLVVVANLREQIIDDLSRKEPHNLNDALESAAALDYCERRKAAMQTLLREGAILVDTTAKQLPAALVNTYLEIKASGRL